MIIEWAEYAKFLVALVAILDVPGNAPMFAQRTAALSLGGRLVVALTASIATAAVLLVFAFYGEAVLATFGVTLEAFKILGGIVILLIALELLGLRAPIEVDDAPGSDNPIAIGVFPIAVPLFAGPGAIAAVMVYAHEDFHSSHDAIVFALVLGAAGVVLVGLTVVALLGRAIGPVTQSVANRLLGVLVGALGVEFILEGLAGFFPALV